MKITATHWLLQDTLKNVAGVISKASNEILRNCLVEVDSEALTVHGTDNDIAVKITLPASCSETGKFMADASFLLSVIKEMPQMHEINLDVKGPRMTVRPGINSSLKMSVPVIQDTEEYPEIEYLNESQVTIPAGDLITLFKNVIHAASPDAIKPVFNGIYLKHENGRLVSVATDQHRLSVFTVEAEVSGITELDEGLVIPLRAVSEMLKMLSNAGGGAIGLSVKGSQLYMSLGNNNRIQFTTRLVAGQFPNWKQVIPKETAFEVIAPRDQLLSVIKRASIFCSSPVNRSMFEIAPGQISIQVESGRGSFEESVPCETTGQMKLGMNLKYLIDTLSSINNWSDKVMIRPTQAMGPMLVTPAPAEEDQALVGDFKEVIMPIQIKEAASE